MDVVLVGGVVVSLGLAPSQADLVKGSAGFVEGRVGDDSVWVVLHRECHRLFPDAMFSDLFAATGRRSVPPRIAAVVMMSQRLFGLSGVGGDFPIESQAADDPDTQSPGFRSATG